MLAVWRGRLMFYLPSRSFLTEGHRLEPRG